MTFYKEIKAPRSTPGAFLILNPLLVQQVKRIDTEPRRSFDPYESAKLVPGYPISNTW